MTTSTTEVNVTTTTLTRATSKAELVDENPDLAAECIQHGAELKVIEPQSIAQPMLANYEPMLTKVCTTGRTGQLLPGGPADRQFDRDESSSVTMDVRKMLDEENIDNDKVSAPRDGTRVVLKTSSRGRLTNVQLTSTLGSH